MSEAVIGSSPRRIDGRLKVSGQAKYAADYHMDGMAYAYPVFSTIAAGRITSMNVDAAKNLYGVLDVFHHGNFPTLHRAPQIPLSFSGILTSNFTDEYRLPFEDEVIYYPGQLVALVVAETFEKAREASYLVQVTYEKDPNPVLTLSQSLKQREPRDGGRGHSRGSPEEAFEASEKRIDVTYTTPVEIHNPMEMHATTAIWQDGKLLVHESSQGVIIHRNFLARVFGLPPDQVEVRAPFIGSGFGSKLWPWPHSAAICAAAKSLDRPVQFMMPRSGMFTAVGQRPETIQRIRIATDSSGKITSLRHESSNSTSFVSDYTENCGGVTQSLYSCPNVLVTHLQAQVHRGTPTSMRAPGAAPGLFALESAIDEMAETIGMDPLEFRKLNISEMDESVGLPWSSNHLQEAIDQGGKRFGWSKRNPAIGSMRDGDEIIGYGMAACNWEAYQVSAHARVSIRSDGTALAQLGVQDIGTGTYTVAAQMVSKLTGLPVEKIEVELGSSIFPAGPVSGGSWATASIVPAIGGATRNALAQLQEFATYPGAPFEGAEPQAISVGEGTLAYDGRTLSFAEILQSQRVARAEGTYESNGAHAQEFSYRSFGAHFVEIGWDPGISRLRVRRVVSAIDVGRAINPLLARNQVEGAIVMGIGMTLFEMAEYDPRDGMMTNNNFAEYAVPVHADQPDMDIILLDYPDLALNELGARGIGEIGTTGLAAAIGNGVYHATGKRIRDLPIVKEKLMEGIMH